MRVQNGLICTRMNDDIHQRLELDGDGGGEFDFLSRTHGGAARVSGNMAVECDCTTVI